MLHCCLTSGRLADLRKVALTKAEATKESRKGGSKRSFKLSYQCAICQQYSLVFMSYSPVVPQTTVTRDVDHIHTLRYIHRFILLGLVQDVAVCQLKHTPVCVPIGGLDCLQCRTFLLGAERPQHPPHPPPELQASRFPISPVLRTKLLVVIILIESSCNVLKRKEVWARLFLSPS